MPVYTAWYLVMLTHYFLQNIIDVVLDFPLLKIVYIPFST